MYELGHSRSVRRRDHLLLTPDTFVRAPLPGMTRATAIVHVGPAIGAMFTQFTAEFEEDGGLAPAIAQRFLYVVEGELRMGSRTLGAGDFAYGATVSSATRSAWSGARPALMNKTYERSAGVAPPESF